jgi:hypothetical protein
VADGSDHHHEVVRVLLGGEHGCLKQWRWRRRCGAVASPPDPVVVAIASLSSLSLLTPPPFSQLW